MVSKEKKLAENVRRAGAFTGLLKQLHPEYKKYHLLCGINVKKLTQYTHIIADLIGQPNGTIEG